MSAGRATDRSAGSLGAIALLVGSAVAGTLVALLDGSPVLWIKSAAAALSRC